MMERAAGSSRATVRADLPAWAADLFRPARYKVLYGGRGSAKSWSIARALLIQAARFPLRVLCAREFQISIRDSVHRLLRDQIDALGLASRFRVGEREIVGSTGALFLFEGLRYNISRIKSMEGIDIAWIEEAQSVSEESLRVLIPTIRKDGSELWFSFNPYLESDPVHRRFVAEPPPDAIVRKVGWRENPWFPPALRAEMERDYRVDPDVAAHVWDGEFLSRTDAQVLGGKCRVDTFEPSASWDGPYHGADWGFAQDPTVLVRLWLADRRLMVEREAHRIGLELDDVPAHWQRHVPGCAEHIIRADSARPETIAYLRRHGLPRLVAADKWPGSVEDGVAWLRGLDEIVIHPRCPETAREARLYSYKVDQRTGDVLPQIVDAHNHTWDSARYALAPLIQASRSVLRGL